VIRVGDEVEMLPAARRKPTAQAKATTPAVEAQPDAAVEIEWQGNVYRQ
jgi:hypothetical protein